MDSKKNIFLVQLFTNPWELYFNFKSNSIKKEINSQKNVDRSKIKTWGDIIVYLKNSILSIGFSISEVMKAMCWFRNKNELLSFVVYYKDENPINFVQLNFFFLIFFILDLFLCMYVPSTKYSTGWGNGIEWNAHKIMGSYFALTSLIEYTYVQYLYSKIWQPNKWYRYFNPIKPWIFSMLAKLDVYTDFCMTVEIYKWQSESNLREYFFIFVYIFIYDILSINTLSSLVIC